MSERVYSARFGERLGQLPQAFERTPANSIWLHAVSVGEIISAAPLVRRLREHRPKVPIYVSTSTVAGRRTAKQHLAGLCDGIFYAPIDAASIVRRVLQTIRPSLLIVLETEIWPNLYRECHKCGIPILLVNARISGRTWPKYHRFRWFFQPLLALPDLVFAQTSADVERYRGLGVPADRLRVEGNLKYDAAAATNPASDLARFGADRVWIAASTVGPNERGSLRRHSVDEDDIVIAAFRDLAARFPRLLLVLAPRQPARFDAVADKLQAAGISFIRRSGGAQSLALPGVLLLDTIGELARWHTIGDVAFVGGSIAPRGGHNVLEPAAAGVPILTGPHMQNFESVAFDLRECGALLHVQNAAELAVAVGTLLEDRPRARTMGEAGANCVREKAGVADRIAPALWAAYDRSFPTPPRSDFQIWIYGLLARRWASAASKRRARAQQQCASREPVPVPVISIGGITIGGAGKTPLANQIARKLRQQGWSPGILTRGYRRRSTAETMLLAPGTLLPPNYTGDEAHIFLRSARAAVGIGSDRYQTAKLLLDRFPFTNVLLLDDGFQHARMPRDLDIVVVDGLDPWGGEQAVPLGRLREPLDMLRRASIVVVTRAEDDHRYAVIRERLSRIARDVPVYRASTRPLVWRDYALLEPVGDVAESKTAAFCGLGNPANFWNTLDQLGINPVFRWEFPDHHHYRILEIEGLLKSARAHGVKWLLTTEKDCNNLPEGTPSIWNGVHLAWLDIELVIEDEERFYTDLSSRLAAAKPPSK